MRAYFLLVLYVAFTTGSALGAHFCTKSCSGGLTSHFSFTEANIPPTECTEKEAFSNVAAVEHRNSGTVKLYPNTLPSTKVLFRKNHFVPSRLSYRSSESAYEQGLAVPLYISQCVFRL